MANSSTKFDSVSYTAVPDEASEGPVPEYEEVAESDADLDQRESSNEKDNIAKTYYSVGPQSFKDNNDCTVVSSFSID